MSVAACGRFDGVVPSGKCPGAEPALAELNTKVAPLVEQYLAALERIKLKEGIRLAMLVSAAGNKFFQARRRALDLFFHVCHYDLVVPKPTRGHWLA